MPEDIGALLREARERAGVSLRDIANTTKISMPTLAALERNDVSRLPGGIFLRSFVRAYAQEVGLDADDTVRRFVARFPDAAVEDTSTVAYQPSAERPVVDDDRPASHVWRVIGWSLPLVAVIVYFGFGGRLMWIRDQLRPSPARVEAQPEQAPPAPATPVMTTPAADASVATATPGSEPATTTAPPAGDAPRPAVDAAMRAADTGRPSAAQEAGAQAPPAAPGAEPVRQAETITAPASEGRFTMLLAPRARCWVTVRSNGRIVFSGTMNPGDRQNLVLGGNVSLTVGNAAAMAFDIDGKPGKPLGREGQVVTALMNAQNLKDFIEAR
jgi:cytoskeleton protein RodZ